MIVRPVVAITGGRRDKPGQGVGRNNILIPSLVQMDKFVRLLGQLDPIEVRHGAAVGTDRYVGGFLEQWERAGGCHIGDVFYRFSYRVNAFPVDPSLDGEWPAAGHRRNLRMLTTEPGVGVLVAFPGGAGTENCIEQAIDDGGGGTGDGVQVEIVMEMDDDRLVFKPEEKVIQPIDGATACVNKWWVYVEGRGVLFFRAHPKSRHLAPQCNDNLFCAEAVRAHLYPWATLKHIPVVYLVVDSEGRIR